MILHGHVGSLPSALVSVMVLSACVVAAHAYVAAPQAGLEAQRQPPGAADDGAYVAGLLGGETSPSGAPRLRVVVARRDVDGAELWSHGCTGHGALSEPRIAVAADGGVVAAITFEGAIDCGSGPIVAAGGLDDFDGLVLKIDRRGAVRWIRTLSDLGAQAVAAVAVDPWGSVVLTGSFEGTVDLGGPPLTAETSRDVFLAQLDADGDFVWQRRFGGAGPSYGVDVDVARSGRIVLLARATSEIDLGSGPISARGGTAVVAAFDSRGRGLWSRGLGGDGEVYPSRLRAIPGNRVLVAGSFAGSVDFGDGPTSSAGRTDAFVVQLDASGHPLGSVHVGAALDEIARGVHAESEAPLALGDILDQITSAPDRPLDPSPFGPD